MKKSIVERVIKLQSMMHEVEMCLEKLFRNLEGEKAMTFLSRLDEMFPGYTFKTQSCEFRVYACMGIRLYKLNGKKVWERISSTSKLEVIEKIPEEDIKELLKAILYCIRG